MKELKLIEKQVNKLLSMENSLEKAELIIKTVKRIYSMKKYVLASWDGEEKENALIFLNNILKINN